MIRYRANNYPPYLEVVKVIKETDTRVWLKTYHTARFSSEGRYYQTMEEAVNDLEALMESGPEYLQEFEAPNNWVEANVSRIKEAIGQANKSPEPLA